MPVTVDDDDDRWQRWRSADSRISHLKGRALVKWGPWEVAVLSGGNLELAMSNPCQTWKLWRNICIYFPPFICWPRNQGTFYGFYCAVMTKFWVRTLSKIIRRRDCCKSIFKILNMCEDTVWFRGQRSRRSLKLITRQLIHGFLNYWYDSVVYILLLNIF
jgi:hypothetical protein